MEILIHIIKEVVSATITEVVNSTTNVCWCLDTIDTDLFEWTFKATMFCILGIYTMAQSAETISLLFMHNLQEHVVPLFELDGNIPFLSSLLFNDLQYNSLVLSSSPVREVMIANMKSVHLVVYHCLEQHSVLFTFNLDSSINILASGTVGEGSTHLELASLDEEFSAAISALKDSVGDIELKITIVIDPAEYAWSANTFFLPLSSYIASNPCSLFAYAANDLNTSLYLINISDNLHSLYGFRNLLEANCNTDYYTWRLTGDDNQADILRLRFLCHNQLMRYIEVIHNIYSPLVPIDSVTSRFFESIYVSPDPNP